MPVHPKDCLKRLAKLDEKVYFVDEIDNSKPKKLIRTKRNIDKMKNIKKQFQSVNENSMNLLLGKFDFDPQKIPNKILHLICQIRQIPLCYVHINL